MELVLDQINATLVSLEVVETKEHVDFVVFQDSEGALQELPSNVEISQVDSS